MPDLSVLVVEDEPTLLRQITSYFRSRGLAVRGVGNSAEASDLLTAGQVDVLVTDIMLPGESGLDLLRRCGELSPDTEVIIITGAPNLPSAEEALRCGAFDYLEKPVRLADLLHRVNQALERVRFVREARSQQAEIRRLNALLARKLESSTAELSEAREQLATSGVLAEVGRLTATVCHELGNPLTSLLAAAEFLQSNSSTISPVRLAEVIHANALRCGRITQMLLDVKRVGVSPTSPVNLAVAVEQARVELATRLDGAATRWSATVPADLPRVLGDHELLVGCLANLIKNAVDAMSGQRSARALRVAAGMSEDRVEITVDDTGPGFAPGVLEHALEPFFTTKASNKGTGLGLAIVAATLRSWNGDVHVENRPGGGGRIRLSLCTADARALHAQKAPARIGQLLAGRRLLIAAPSGEVRELLQIAFSSWGAVVITAETSAEVLAACRDTTPEALLLEAQSAKLDALDLYQELQGAYPLAAARVIPMATVSLSPALSQFLDTFPGPVLTKPFGVRRVAEVLEMVIQAHSSGTFYRPR